MPDPKHIHVSVHVYDNSSDVEDLVEDLALSFSALHAEQSDPKAWLRSVRAALQLADLLDVYGVGRV